MVKNSFEKYCYELYKEDWKKEHGITREVEMECIRDYIFGMESEDYEDFTYEEYLEEFGYDGECYCVYEEFLENEFIDTEYMTKLLKSNEKLGATVCLLEMYKRKTNITEALNFLIGKRFSTIKKIANAIEETGTEVKCIANSQLERPKDSDYMIDFQIGNSNEGEFGTLYYIKDNEGNYYITEVEMEE